MNSPDSRLTDLLLISQSSFTAKQEGFDRELPLPPSWNFTFIGELSAMTVLSNSLESEFSQKAHRLLYS